MATKPHTNFDIVAVGASAGGLQAFTEFVSVLPVKSGKAFVLMQHLDPDHKSQLATLLQKHAAIPVIELTDGLSIAANTVYVVPPGFEVTFKNSVCKLQQPKKHKQTAIDRFLIALSKEYGSRLTGILLSGTGSDGAQGIKSIRDNGGTVYTQDNTADFVDMPESASLYVSKTHILSPVAIAQALTQHNRLSDSAKPEELLSPILDMLQSAMNIDFRQYKLSTVKRRVARRMRLSNAKTPQDYYRLLQTDSTELTLLAKDMLIHVSSFFRDQEQNEALSKNIFDKLVKQARSNKSVILIWVPGCSTGEEVYSLAILLDEYLQTSSQQFQFKIIGTDIDSKSINDAKLGKYQKNIAEHMTAARLESYFAKQADTYTIIPSLKKHCEFKVQDITKKSLIENAQLISCHNTLIYLGEELQQKALSNIYAALADQGFLLLAKAEGLSNASQSFTTINSRLRIFRRGDKAVGLSNRATIIETNDLYSPLSLSISPKQQSAPVNDTQRMEKINKLRESLALTQQYSDEILSELEALNEELQVTNEEMETANEELHTTNEELHTAQEELQTSNDELKTLNDLLESRNDDLEISRAYTAAIIDTIREPLLVLDARLCVISANESFYKVFKVTQKNTEGNSLSELGNGQWNITSLNNLLKKILPDKLAVEDYVVEHNFNSIGHKTMLLNARRLVQGPDKQPLILLAIEDVTEAHDNRRQLEDSEAKFKTLADNIPVLCWMASPDGTIHWYNTRWYTYTGNKPGKNLDEMRDQVLDPLELPDTLKKWQRGLKMKQEFEMVSMLRGKHGDYSPFLTRITPVKDPDGRVLQWFGTHTDITEEKKLIEHRDEFIGVASHELKTPVTSIKAYTQILGRRFQKAGDAASAEIVAKMDTQLTKLTGLVGDLLDVTRIEAGRLQLRENYFDFDQLVQEIVEQIQPSAAKHQIITDFTFTPSINADRERIGQVITNYLSNAIKYSPGADKIKVLTYKDNDSIVFCVEDYGVGLSKSDQTRVFERFYRVNGDGQETYPGLGLGLFISAEIIKRQGGRVWVDSTKAKGSRFCFSLPLQSKQSAV